MINLAAQAIVRFSISNPKDYLKSNINGFNILDLSKSLKLGILFMQVLVVYMEQMKIFL